MVDQPVKPSWRNRRRFLFAANLFSAVVIAYVLGNDLQSGVAETAVLGAFATIISTIGSYVFGAAWQDINLGK